MNLPVATIAALVACIALLPARAASDARRPVLVVGGDHENPPYEYLENGKPTGFDVELMRAAAEIAGFDVQNRLGPWANARRDLEEGRVDALSGMYFSEERSKLVDFSVPHTLVRSALFVREGSPIRSFADLRGKVVILQEGDVRHDLFQRTEIAGRIIAVTDADEQLRLLAAGRGDCALMTSRLQGEYYVKRLGLRKLRIIDAGLPQLRYCFAVRKGNAELLGRLDEALNVLKVSGRYREIHERWFGVYERPDVWKYARILAVALAVLTTLLAASLLWSRSLERKVRLRTAALQASEEELRRANGELRQAHTEVRDAHAELREAHAELERRVEERTAEYRRANKQLRVSEQEKGIILNSTSDIVTFLDPDMRIQWGNQRAAALARTTIAGLTGRHCFEAFHGRSTPCVGCPVALAMKTGEPQNAEMSHPGEEIFLRAYPVKDEQGRLVGAVEFSLDVTDRKRAEAALRESEERFRGLITALPVAVYTCDREGRITFYNEQAKNLWGRSPEIGRDLWCGSWRIEGIDGSTVPLDECPMAQTLKTGQRVEGHEIIIERPDGSRANVMPHPEPLHGASGAMVGAVNVLVDVTDRKRQEEALRESEARYARLAATVPGVLYEFERYPDDSGCFTYLSGRCKEVFETDGQEFLKDLDTMVEPEDRRVLGEASLAASRSRSPLTAEVRITTPSGRSKWVQFTSLSCSAPSVEIDRRSGLIVDITERKRMEEALRESQEWLKLTVEATGLGTLHTVPYGGPAVVSPRFREMCGLVDDAALQDFEAFLRIVHPDDRDEVREAVARSTDPAGDGLCDFEYRCVRPDGTVRWIAVRAKTQFAAVGGVRRGTRFAAVTLDITDRKREEEALRKSEERYARLVATVPGVIYEVEYQPDGTIHFTYLSPRCEELFELGRETLLADMDVHRNMMNPKEFRAFAEAALSAERSRTRLSHDVRITTPSGRGKWIQFTSLPCPSAPGELSKRSGFILDITERKRAEEALKESEEWLKLTVDATGAGTAHGDPFSNWLTLSPRYRQIFGVPDGIHYDLDAFFGFVHPDDREVVREGALASLDPSGNGRADHQFRIVRPDGSVRWIAARAKTEFAEVDGVMRAVRHAAVTLDVTERKREEEALRESEERFHTLADNIAQLAWMADARGEIFWFNRRCLEYTGAGAGTLQLGPFLHPEHVGRVAEKMSRALSTGEVFEDTFQLRGKDGRYRWFLSRAVPVRDSAGEVVRWLGTATDVTEQREVEEALRESEARYARLAATVPGVIYEVEHDPGETGLEDFRYTYLSPRCEEIFELDRDALLADMVSLHRRTFHPDDLQAFLQAALVARRSRGRFSAEVRITTPSGQQKWLQFNSLPCPTAPGEPVKRSGIILDVTERKRTEEALREAQEWLELTVEATGAGILNTVPFAAPILSPRFREMLGLPDDHGIDGFEAFSRLVHPDDREMSRVRVLQALDPSGDGRFDGVHRFLRPDRSVRWLAVTGKVQFAEVDGARRAVRLASVYLDITDRKREEQALRESEERFHALAENIPQHAFMLDASGQVFWINRHARDYAGNEGMGSGYLALIHPDHRGRVGEKVKRCLETGATFEEIFPFRGTEGQYRWFLCRVVPLRDDAGNVVRWFGTNTDVTEQREVEEALRESEARARHPGLPRGGRRPARRRRQDGEREPSGTSPARALDRGDGGPHGD